ncbi:MAG: hypothetical protein IPG04_40805 [Polyangiaceae bacterium]|nr:hypothetical protein [Polyangiaceae bacterium]
MRQARAGRRDLGRQGRARSSRSRRSAPTSTSASRLLPGKGDSAWLFTPGKSLVAFDAGSFKRLPGLAKPPKNAFVSSEGELFASDGATIHRLERDAWLPVAHLAWPTTFGSIASHEGAFWVTLGGRLKKLVPGEAVAFREGCSTPFVLLYDVSWKSEPTYTFPHHAQGPLDLPRT